MEAVQKVNETLEQHRSTLTASQLKKLRKKRGKLLQQVVHEQLNGEEPVAKRLCLEPSPERELSSSLQLSCHEPGTAAAHIDQEVVSPPQKAVPGQQRKQQQRPGQSRPPRPQATSTMQQPQQQPWSAAHLQQQPCDSKRQVLLQPAVPASSTSTGPCRTDLSGQLVVIQQTLNSNTTADHSNSTFSQLLLQHPAAAAPASSDCSHGTQPAAAAAGVQLGAGADSLRQQQQQQRQGQQQPQQQSRKSSRPNCQYGNYHHYYGYRLKPSGFEDPRLKVLDSAWFHGADVLDVGCNEGLVSLALAVHCGCRSVTGVDIDPVLVSKACTNLSRSRSQLNQQLHQAVRDRNAMAMRTQPQLQQEQQQQPEQQQQQQAHEPGPLGIIVASTMQPPASRHSRTGGNAAAAAAGTAASTDEMSQAGVNAASSTDLQGAAGSSEAPPQQQVARQQPQQQQQQQHKKPPHAHRPPQDAQQQQQQQQQGPKARIISTQRQIKALSRVSFRAGNWLDLPCPSNKYEVITCFSVTKWIQLNWGDDGIIRLFTKFYRCLAPGGLLVLEPQPFKSYKNAINKPGVKDAAFADLDQLRLRPEQFAEYLVQQVGFQLVQRLSAVSEAAGAEAVSVKGFDRPILVLRKPAAAAGQAAAATGAH